MAEKSDPVDVTQLAKRKLTETAFPGGGKEDFRVFFDPKIHARIAAHAAERLSLEICGVLVGHWHSDAGGPFVVVEESIRCDKAVSNAGDVTFTHDAWNEVHREMDTKFTDRDIVGWYHTHPNFGIFLSERDCFIQDHFFNGPGQIAYVVDPVNNVEGVFAWRGGKAKLRPHFWVGDEIHLSSQGTARTPSSAPPAGQTTPSAPAAESRPPLSLTMTWVLAAVCLLLLGYLLGSRWAAWEHNMLVKGVVAHYGLFKGLKPGLRENVDQVNESLEKITQVVDALAKEQIKALAGDAAEEKKKQWAEVEMALLLTDKKLQDIKNLYSLSSEEASAVQELINAKEAELENVRIETAKNSAARNSTDSAPAAKPAGEKPAAEPAKGSAAPAAKVAETKAAEAKAETNKQSETNKKP